MILNDESLEKGLLHCSLNRIISGMPGVHALILKGLLHCSLNRMIHGMPGVHALIVKEHSGEQHEQKIRTAVYYLLCTN